MMKAAAQEAVAEKGCAAATNTNPCRVADCRYAATANTPKQP